MLVGLVKKNGIMMVDFALEVAATHGKSAEEAIFEACLVRFRPIMMTTMAALMGTLPIAMGFGAGAESRRPLGLAVVGGLLFSQVLTLYVTPVFYIYMDKLQQRLNRGKRRGKTGLTSRTASPRPPPSSSRNASPQPSPCATQVSSLSAEGQEVRLEDLVARDGDADQGVWAPAGSVALNGIFPSCSGALPSLRRNGSQRGSEWMLAKRFSTRTRMRLVSCAAAALSSHSKALSASPRKA